MPVRGQSPAGSAPGRPGTSGYVRQKLQVAV